MASQTKPFARCSIVDLAYEISLAASASTSGSALDSAAAQLLLPSLRNAGLVEAVLQRHPRVQSSEGLMCFATPASKQAWCEMLRDLFQSAGVAVSDAACLRVYLVLKECAKRGRVTLAPARSSHLQRVARHPVPAHIGEVRHRRRRRGRQQGRRTHSADLGGRQCRSVRGKAFRLHQQFQAHFSFASLASKWKLWCAKLPIKWKD